MQCLKFFFFITLLACATCNTKTTPGIIEKIWTWRMKPELIDPAKRDATTTPIVYQSAALVGGMTYLKFTLPQALAAGFLVFGLNQLSYQLTAAILLAAHFYKSQQKLYFVGLCSGIYYYISSRGSFFPGVRILLSNQGRIGVRTRL